MHYRRVFASTALIAVLVSPLAADWPVTEKLDLDAIYRIKEEGLQRSKVMEIESYLTDVYGPRLTGSPNIKEAADWAQKTMKEWGLANVHLETFPFGRGWQNQRFVAHGADAARLSAHRLSESVDARHERAGHRRSGDGGDPEREGLRHLPRKAARQVRARRRRCATCRRSSRRPAAATRTPNSTDLAKQPAGGPRPRPRQPRRTPAFARKRTQFWIDEGVAAVLDISRGDGGTRLRAGAAASARRRSDPPQPPQVVLAVEHYGRICRDAREAAFRSRCRSTSTTGSTTRISTPSTSSASCRAPTRPTKW